MALERAISILKSLLPNESWSDDPKELHPHLTEWRGRWAGKTPLLLKPAFREEVELIVRVCRDNGCKLVPQGGNTGLVGGGIPDESGKEFLLSTKRLNKYIHIDKSNNAVTVDAGVTVQALQDAVKKEGFLFPLSLASQGSCTVGGVVSTNAGGVHVLKYGNAKDLMLGLEAVLPNGEVISELSGLRKDNTGYKISQLLAGAEGTLGIITKVTFKLFPEIQQQLVAMVNVTSPYEAVELLEAAKAFFGNNLSAFELIPRSGIELVEKHISNVSLPYPMNSAWSVLMEFETVSRVDDFYDNIACWLDSHIKTGLIVDGTLAQNEAQNSNLWLLRESLSEAQKKEGPSIKHDISLPISEIASFLEVVTGKIKQQFPEAKSIAFGHLGDGNLHYNFNIQASMPFNETEKIINNITFHEVVERGGSISAEHGIGRLRVKELKDYKGSAELQVMRAIKGAIDPHNTFNPGKIF